MTERITTIDLLRHGALYLFLATLLFSHAATAAITATDDRGKHITLPQPATRIISLTPHLTEIAFAAGAGGKLVGVSAYGDYPAGAHQIPIIGDFSKIDLERVVQLRPDLVLAWVSGNPRGDVERLEQLGFKVLALEPRKLDDIARHLLLIGELAGAGYEATRAASRYRSQIRLLESKYRARKPVTVFYEIWHQPLMTIGQAHLVSRAIELCGGRNVFADVTGLAPTVSMEALLARNPQVILVSGALNEREARLAPWREMKELQAVRQAKVFYLNADTLHRATPRMAEGIGELCEKLDQARRMRP